MIDSQKVAYSRGKNDEHVTPEYAITPLLEFISSGAKIW